MPNDPQDYDKEQYKLIKAHTKDIKEFFEHLGSYVAVNAALFAIDWLTGGGWWFYWPMLGWGVGLAIHGMSVFVKVPIMHHVSHLEWRELRRVVRWGRAFGDDRQPTGQRKRAITQQLFEFYPIHAINSPLDSDVDRRLNTMERQLENE